MSAPQAQKFQDHYLVLGVEPKSDSDTISKAYQTLAKRFHPENKVTGDKEKYKAVTEAYETLADPNSRAAFDSLRNSNVVDTTPPTFSGRGFFDSFGYENARRRALLCVMYDRRRLKPFTPSLSLRQLEAIIDMPTEDLNFAIWYLKQRGFMISDDKSSLLITIEGMDYLERNLPTYNEIEKLLRPADQVVSAD